MSISMFPPQKILNDKDFDFSSQKNFLQMWIWIYEDDDGGDRICMAMLG